MNADKHFVFISVNRRSSAAICLFLTLRQLQPQTQRFVDLLKWARGQHPGAPRDLVPRDRNDFVNHYLRLLLQPRRSPCGHRNAKKWRVLQMARNQAHRHARVSAVEEVGLDDHSRSRLAVVSRCRTNDHVAALYLHPDVSASPYQSASCSFLETSSD